MTYRLCEMYIQKNLPAEKGTERDAFIQEALNKFDAFLLTNRITVEQYNMLLSRMGVVA